MINFIIAGLLVAVSMLISKHLDFIIEAWYCWKGRTQTEEIEHIFECCWNGEEVCREAAWYRTVKHLETYGSPAEMITEARLRLLMLEKPRRREHHLVGANGRLVKVTETGGSRQ